MKFNKLEWYRLGRPNRQQFSAALWFTSQVPKTAIILYQCCATFWQALPAIRRGSAAAGQALWGPAWPP